MVTRILVDTSALLALLDGDDPRQDDVKAAFAEHRDSDLVTHGYFVAESLAVARRRLGVDATISLLDDVLPAIEVLPVDADLHAAAQRLYRASLPSATSFVDRVSLELMARDGITVALALDDDLASAGGMVLPSE